MIQVSNNPELQFEPYRKSLKQLLSLYMGEVQLDFP